MENQSTIYTHLPALPVISHIFTLCKKIGELGEKEIRERSDGID
jgi:hypothetical protein